MLRPGHEAGLFVFSGNVFRPAGKGADVCGIIGYVGRRPCKELLLEGLRRLEYRGYDSAGIALREDDALDYVRAVGNLGNLVEAAGPNGSHSPHGLGHTRWATHGAVTERNAHPLAGCEPGRLAIVLNGIIENYVELREQLAARGHTLTSETDAEVVVHLLEEEYDGDLAQALCRVYPQLEGHFSIVAIHHDQPDLLAGVRHQTPLVIGLGEGENFLASSIAAFLSETRTVIHPRDGEVVEVTPEGVHFFADGAEVDAPETQEIDWDDESAEKGGYETFMLKEIFEQPDAVAETIADRVHGDTVDLGDLGGITDDFLRGIRRIVFVACGTSYHAGLVGRYAVEEWARVPVEMDIASEYRYRNPVVGPDDLVVGISQSGETADTLAAMRTARERGARVLALTNIMGSQATREADGVLYTRAGLEIGVAATKSFVTQVTVLYLLALRLAELRGTMEPAELKETISDVKRLPHRMSELFERHLG